MIRATDARELKQRANESFRKYNKMKNDVNNLIIFASNTGVGECEYSEPDNIENEILFGILQNELISLGYEVSRCLNPKGVKLYISWD